MWYCCRNEQKNIMNTDTAHGLLTHCEVGIMNYWGKMHYLTNNTGEIGSLEWVKIKLESYLHTRNPDLNIKGKNRKLLGENVEK